MILLAIDTATLRPAVALDLGDGRAAVSYPEPGPKHGRLLVPAIRDLLGVAGLRAVDLGAIAVGLGPGSFTGLRVGVTAAKALAYAAGRPVVGLSSLEALARGADPGATRVEVAADAQRGDLFAASFARSAPGEPLRRLGPDRLVPADAWAAELPDGAEVVCPTPDRIAAVLPPRARLSPSERDGPDGLALLAMAAEAVADGRFADLWALEPAYLRRSAAEEKADADAPAR